MKKIIRSIFIINLLLLIMPQYSFAKANLERTNLKALKVLKTIVGYDPRYQDGLPKKIGILYKTTTDPFINNTIDNLEKIATDNKITTIRVLNQKDGAEQINVLNDLIYKDYVGFIIEAFDKETVRVMNDIAFKNNVFIVYFNEALEIPDDLIPPFKRIAKVAHNSNYAEYQFNYCIEYFKKNNMRKGTIILASDKSDSSQDLQANRILDYFKGTSKKSSDYSLESLELRNYDETIQAVDLMLTSNSNILAVFTTNNNIAQWVSFAIRGYKIKQSKNTIKGLRRSRRTTSSISSTKSSQGTKLENIAVLTNNVRAEMLNDLDEGLITMAIFRDDQKFSKLIMNRLFALAKNDLSLQNEIYKADYVRSDNLFEYANQLREIEKKARLLEKQELEEQNIPVQ